ncbi:flagellar hook-length control protein FliK [Desulfogranum mediterraneum]|uniref:flagellar hook-length control protein FliK n=1 Tax=Desulfogranum mediterraneum TaxID=160661 RepID=UPI000403E103|nr:flagellar hook-length control protein FliK [Desulfogranum mediterraneum]
MDFPVTPASTLRIQQLYRQQDQLREHHRTPFSPGQLLQAVVEHKIDPSNYLLTIAGRQLQAQSALPLQVGQQLDLQVTTAGPKIELRVITDPLTRQLGSRLHLLGGQQGLLPNLAQLGEGPHLKLLSENSRNTLTLLSQTIPTLPGSPPAATAVQGSTELLGAILHTLQTNPTTPLKSDGALPGLIQTIAPGLGSEQASTSQAAPSSQPGIIVALATTVAGNGPSLHLLQEAVKAAPPGTPHLLELGSQILDFFTTNPKLFPTRELFSILSQALGTTTADAPLSRPEQSPQGGQLQQLLDHLGLRMEQLFAAGRGEEASHTLKFALLELSQSGKALPPAVEQGSQLLQTLELYQMLQVRLAGESLFFLPMPLPFLQQGFLLIDEAPEHDPSGEQQERQSRNYSLHLELTGLGTLQIELHQEGERLDIRFHLEDREKMTFMGGYREELEQWLTRMELHSVQFLTGAKDPTKTLLDLLLHDTTGMVNTKA